jgi:ElaB/YqjD/DUF883 family membrane-anchored ribosome-binding protein
MSSRVVSVEQLSRESEEARIAFLNSAGALSDKVSETVDDLRERLTPSHVKREVNSYVRQEGSEILASIERRARNNPLQAVAIGAAVVYPFWGILKSVPMPILLIGGGWWLSTQKTGTIATAVTDGASDIAHSAQQTTDKVVGAIGAMTSSLNGTADTLKDAAEGAIDSATTKAEQVTTAIKDASAEAAEAISAKAAAFEEAGRRAVDQSRTVFDDLIDRNPLLVGGFALAIGAVIAASLPGTRVENALLGVPSEQIKGKAREAASQGVERAKDVVADIAEDVASAAADEGLTKEGLSSTIEGVASAVKAVVGKGLASALGDSTPTSGQ